MKGVCEGLGSLNHEFVVTTYPGFNQLSSAEMGKLLLACSLALAHVFAIAFGSLANVLWQLTVIEICLPDRVSL